jgi:hypothetical protein
LKRFAGMAWKIKRETRGRKTSPSPEHDLHRAVRLATALALAGVLAGTTLVARLATALAFAGILAFAAVLVRIGIISQLAFANGSGRIFTAAGWRVNARCRTGHQPGESDGGKHGPGGLEETWIFHVCIDPFLFSNGVVVLQSIRHQPKRAERCSVRREGLDFIPRFCPFVPTDFLKISRRPFFEETSYLKLFITPSPCPNLLWWVLIRDGLFVGVIGPNRGLNPGTTLIAHQTRWRPCIGSIVWNTTTMSQHESSGKQESQTHGLVCLFTARMQVPKVRLSSR